MAAGAYELGLPDGWMGMVGDASAGGALSPLAVDAVIDVRPSTATLYGFVRNTDRAGLANVTVTVNGMPATTDDLGRYIVSGISRVRGQLFVNTERAGYPATNPDSTNNADTDVPTFEANMVKRHDFQLSGANNTVAITGTVVESGTGAGIKGVRIKVDGKDPLNGLPSGSKKGQLLTGDDGTYKAVVAVPAIQCPNRRGECEQVRLSLPTPIIPRRRHPRGEPERQFHRLPGHRDYRQGDCLRAATCP